MFTVLNSSNRYGQPRNGISLVRRIRVSVYCQRSNWRPVDHETANLGYDRLSPGAKQLRFAAVSEYGVLTPNGTFYRPIMVHAASVALGELKLFLCYCVNLAFKRHFRVLGRPATGQTIDSALGPNKLFLP